MENRENPIYRDAYKHGEQEMIRKATRLCRDIGKGVIDKLQDMIRWIPVDERLPEPYQIVWVYFGEERKPSIAQFFALDDGGVRWYPELDMVEVKRYPPAPMYGPWEEVEQDRQFYAKPTHWMAITEPPTQT